MYRVQKAGPRGSAQGVRVRTIQGVCLVGDTQKGGSGGRSGFREVTQAAL